MELGRSRQTLSSLLGVDSSRIESLGVEDRLIASDRDRFIDPFLLPRSEHREMREAYVTLQTHMDRAFEVIKDSVTNCVVTDQRQLTPKELAERAMRDLEFSSKKDWLFSHFVAPEAKEIACGYAKDNNAGTGIGEESARAIVNQAARLFALGIGDATCLITLPCLPSHVGPDRLSDLIASVIRPHTEVFTARIVDEILEGVVAHRRKACRDRVRNSGIHVLPSDVLCELSSAEKALESVLKGQAIATNSMYYSRKSAGRRLDVEMNAVLFQAITNELSKSKLQT